jgi:hypothetical protein
MSDEQKPDKEYLSLTSYCCKNSSYLTAEEILEAFKIQTRIIDAEEALTAAEIAKLVAIVEAAQKCKMKEMSMACIRHGYYYG